MDVEINRQSDSTTERQMDRRRTDTKVDRLIDRHTCRHKYTNTDREKRDEKTESSRNKMDGPKDRQIQRGMVRQTGRGCPALFSYFPSYSAVVGLAENSLQSILARPIPEVAEAKDKKVLCLNGTLSGSVSHTHSHRHTHAHTFCLSLSLSLSRFFYSFVSSL